MSSSLSRHAYSWCSCPYCPNNGFEEPPYSPRRFPSLPRYRPGHRHHICEWCDVWQRLGPGYEIDSLSPELEDSFDDIHNYFKGVCFPPSRIAQNIRSLAKNLEIFNTLQYQSPKMRQLTEELYLLAEDVRGGLVSDTGSNLYSRLPGAGFHRNHTALGWRD